MIWRSNAMPKKYEIQTLQALSRDWAEVNVTGLPIEKQEKYFKRKKAVDMYIGGFSLKEIQKQTGISGCSVIKCIEKCISTDIDGNICGYSSLIPNKRQSVSNSRFTSFMNNNIEIRDKILKRYFKPRKGTDKNINISKLHEFFVRELIKKGFTETEYPLSLSDAGKRNLYRYISSIEKNMPLGFVRISDDAKKLHASTGGEVPIVAAPIRPFQKVELDGHKIDALWNISVKTDDGDYIKVKTERIWILAIIDVATRVIIGYCISIEPEYNQYDVLLCMENSIIPYESITEMADGFYSQIISSAQWSVFEEIYMDNAMSHLSKAVCNQVKVNGITIIFGPVATPISRPHIERFFKTLEEMCFHRLPSTTGSDINDIRRVNAETDALKYDITLDNLMEITEIAISEYNKKPHNSLKGFSPLGIMEQRIDMLGYHPRKVPINKREDFGLKIYEERKIRGNKSSGIRPYISFMNNRYTSPQLADSYHLIGNTIYLEIDPKNIYEIKGTLESGITIDNLKIKGMHESTVLPMKELKAINTFKNEMGKRYMNTSNAIDEYLEHIENKALTSKKAANKLAKSKNIITGKEKATKKIENDKLKTESELLEEMKKLNPGFGEDK